jgi:hypothetical protein
MGCLPTKNLKATHRNSKEIKKQEEKILNSNPKIFEKIRSDPSNLNYKINIILAEDSYQDILKP